MSKKNKTTEAVLILDASGSMSFIKKDTIGSIENFIREQKELDAGKLVLSIIEFNEKVLPIIARTPIDKIPDKYENYNPRGMTALLDAIGLTVYRVDKIIADLKEKKKPDSVVVIIMTDGHENSSKEYNSDTIKKLIEKKQDDGWSFVFLGANQDAFATGMSMGIVSTGISNYKSTSKGTKAAYAASSAYLAQTRTGEDTDGWDSDINKQGELICKINSCK